MQSRLNLHWLFECLVVLAATVLSVQSAQAAPPGSGWGLIFADEFGGSELDSQKWIDRYPWQRADTRAQNVTVTDGKLNLIQKREPWNGSEFSGCAVTSRLMDGPEKDLFNFTYGYAEARIKLPTLPGNWPAFWLLQGGWPPEVDIMEDPVFTDYTHGIEDYYANYHYTNSSGAHASSGGWVNPGSVGNITTDFHTFGFEWTDTYLKWYFDGIQVRSFTNATEIADLVDAYLLLTNGWGDWPGMPTLEQWPLGVSDKAQVDWVRVWKKTSGYSSATAWTLAGSGSWDTSSNWSLGSPQIGSQIATFGSVAASNVTVDWNYSRTVGGIIFNSPVNYTLGSGNDSIMLSSASPITSEQPNATTVLIDASGATGASPNVVNSRLELYNNVTIRSPNKPMTLNGEITGPGSLRIDSGQITLKNAASYAGSTTIAGGTLKLEPGPTTVAVAHRWNFNNSLADSVGSSNASIIEVGGNNVILSSTQATMTGGASGSSDFIRLGSNLLPNTNVPVAIELWATPKNLYSYSRIFDFGSSTSENLYMAWTKGTDINTTRVEWKDGATNLTDNTPVPYNLNTEYHIVMLLEPIDGATEVSWYSAPSGSADLGPALGAFTTTNTLSSFFDNENNLGRSFWSSDGTANASYNEVRFWSGQLNSTWLELLHDAGPDANLNSLNIGYTRGMLPSSTALTLSGSGATLDINGLDQTVASLSGVSGTSVLLGSGKLTVGGSGTSTTYSGNISGTGDMIKTGAGTLTLAGNISIGSMSINAGALQVNSLSASMHDITGGGALRVGNGSVAAQLTADSIAVASLTIAAGAKLTIAPIPGGPLSTSIQPVPEPSSIVLLILAGSMLVAARYKRRK